MEIRFPPPRKRASEIFDSYFRDVFDALTLARAQNIFQRVGWQNERSIAIQLHWAIHTGKVDKVLEAYETIMDPVRGFVHLVPNKEALAVDMMRFADVIYGSVIAEGNQMLIFDLAGQIEIPEIFDEMDTPNQEDVAELN